MDQSPAISVVMGIEMTIVNDVPVCRWHTGASFSGMRPSRFSMPKSKYADAVAKHLCQGLHAIMEELDLQGILPPPAERGLLLNISNSTWIDIARYAQALDRGKRAVRPHMTISFESSLPTAQANILMRIQGPSATLADRYGHSGNKVWAHNMLIDRMASLIFAADVERDYGQEDSGERFSGRLSISALMRTADLGSCVPMASYEPQAGTARTMKEEAEPVAALPAHYPERRGSER
ncbi:hypothetical protein [Paenibacillus thiaminolyticus]|uniref:Uncharacterized protein n=1 Tax=Paenibacillus thiaminolyticus TaxID=49283 RepID=A0A3A3GFU3_PANTH|nr:hypothetical protein [Paenibacillus thiaminolyticus]RJG21712.1 hypothetical protein DQX05_20070 [Paenibacillus thiaminolyticus]